MGHDLVSAPHEVRKSIAMTGQFASLDEDLTGRENLMLLAQLWGFRGRARRTCRPVARGVRAGRRGAPPGEGLLGRHAPQARHRGVADRDAGVLFLDEPTTGLDPNARKSVWRMIRALAGEGVTILLTTQYLDEADQLAARIAVIDHGRKIAEGTSRELKAATGSGFLHVTLTDPRPDRRRRAAARSKTGRRGATQRGRRRAVGQANSPHEANAALRRWSRPAFRVADFSMAAPSLDEVFFALTGHGAESASCHGRTKMKSESSIAVIQVERPAGRARSRTRSCSAGAPCSSSSTCPNSCSTW